MTKEPCKKCEAQEEIRYICRNCVGDLNYSTTDPREMLRHLAQESKEQNCNEKVILFDIPWKP